MSNAVSRRQENNRRGILAATIAFFSFLMLATFISQSSAADMYCFRDENGTMYFTNIAGPGRSRMRYPIAKTVGRQRVMNTFPATGGELYAPVITSASQIFSVDEDLVRAVIKAESNFNPRALSPKGAMGLMQLMPSTAREMGVADPFDPADNIHGGVAYLSRLLETLKGDMSLALAAYNAGPSRVLGPNRVPPIDETRHYVEEVLNYYYHLKGRNRI